MMLFVSIERDRAADVVRWFEDLKDRYADLVIPFDKILAVGQAYIDLGEFEAAVLVFRATAEASFLKEAGVAQTLEGLGEIRASTRFLRRLLESYPDLNTMRQSLYGVGQKLGLIASRMTEGAPVDEKVGTRRELQEQAVDAFRDFLIMYPEDPLAAEVSFSWATTCIEMRELAQALAVAEGALARYPSSSLEDEFLYTVGLARFVSGEPREAFAPLERVAAEEFPRPAGGSGPSENRKHAIYLEGQIHHALGEIPAALERYDAVKQEFGDASEAADYFRRRELTLPEVVRFGTDEKAALTLNHRNLDEVSLKVYRVDLMRLYLLHKSLNDIRDIQLHGIRPYEERVIDLRTAAPYVDHEREVEIPLEEAGAYLVVARSGALIASGMVLRTDLQIEVQESFDIGRVRVNVKHGESFVAGAHVKVVGSGDGRFQGGDTDPRGVFVADDVVGRATVIVRMGDAYAFHRGEQDHQPARVPRPEPAQQREVQTIQRSKGFDAWENNIRTNESNRARQIEWLEKEVLQKQQKGVEVFRAK
jgi:tetratricopeptide (TPR) repeat protein